MNDDYTGPRPKVFDANYDRFKRSAKHEKRVALKVGGRALNRSGGMAWSSTDKGTEGGDIKTPLLLIEHKRVEPQTLSISIKREWMKKVTEGAKRSGKVPSLAVTFEKADGFEEDWLMVPLDVAINLLGLKVD